MHRYRQSFALRSLAISKRTQTEQTGVPSTCVVAYRAWSVVGLPYDLLGSAYDLLDPGQSMVDSTDELEGGAQDRVPSADDVGESPAT